MSRTLSQPGQQPGAHAIAHQLETEVDVPLLVSHPKAALLPVLQQLGHGWDNVSWLLLPLLL